VIEPKVDGVRGLLVFREDGVIEARDRGGLSGTGAPTSRSGGASDLSPSGSRSCGRAAFSTAT
jgi:hypothetical protein